MRLRTGTWAHWYIGGKLREKIILRVKCEMRVEVELAVRLYCPGGFYAVDTG